MVKTRKRLILLIALVISVVLVINLSLGFYLNSRTSSKQQQPNTQPSPTQKIERTFSYKGVQDKDALTLLKEKASVEQNSTGLVTAINNVSADEKKKEYWAFYVNGRLASVGSKEYITNDTDVIEWKLETY